ncbi:MAG: hypothetical protein NW220_09000 [Leptolyngbyaceae cyanobacterium bins.349]|nr:hypothetical protein [Leptolyngbyaceae cyanobacterium bins.349]
MSNPSVTSVATMPINKKLELRIAPAEGTQLYRVFHYLLRNLHLVGDGRGKATEAITAFWLPFALEHEGEKPELVKRVARDCVLLLEQHIYLLRRTFDLELSDAPVLTAASSSSPSPLPQTAPTVE